MKMNKLFLLSLFLTCTNSTLLRGGGLELSKAIRTGNLEKVKNLIAIDRYRVNIKDQYGQTPLITAVIDYREDIVKFLMQNGAKINQRDGFGSSALYIAMVADAFMIMKYLTECGADLNSKNMNDRSPLSWAKEVHKKSYSHTWKKTQAIADYIMSVASFIESGEIDESKKFDAEVAPNYCLLSIIYHPRKTYRFFDPKFNYIPYIKSMRFHTTSESVIGLQELMYRDIVLGKITLDHRFNSEDLIEPMFGKKPLCSAIMIYKICHKTRKLHNIHFNFLEPYGKL